MTEAFPIAITDQDRVREVEVCWNEAEQTLTEVLQIVHDLKQQGATTAVILEHIGDRLRDARNLLQTSMDIHSKNTGASSK